MGRMGTHPCIMPIYDYGEENGQPFMVQPPMGGGDVEELIERGARAVVLSKGFHERLKVTEDAISYLEQHNVEVHILKTGKAVVRYNELAQKIPVGGLFHSTC